MSYATVCPACASTLCPAISGRGQCPKADARDVESVLVDALEAVLLFHAGGPWDGASAQRWRDLTGGDNASTKGLCDVVRAALAKTRGGA